MQHETHEPIPFIRELCKGHTEKEILEAEERFRDYLRIVRDICDQDGTQDEAIDMLERAGLLSEEE